MSYGEYLLEKDTLLTMIGLQQDWYAQHGGWHRLAAVSNLQRQLEMLHREYEASINL